MRLPWTVQRANNMLGAIDATMLSAHLVVKIVIRYLVLPSSSMQLCCQPVRTRL